MRSIILSAPVCLSKIMAATFDVATLAFAPLVTTAKGAKQLPALTTDGDPVVWQPLEWCSVPFEPSAFSDPDANRVTLCVTPSDAMARSIAELDAWCIATIAANPAILGISLTTEQVSERYASSLKVSDKGYATLRAKMNKSGRYALKCYDSEKEPIAQPDTWRGCSVRPRLVFKGLWVMGKDFGTTLECTHAIVQSSEGCDDCPF